MPVDSGDSSEEERPDNDEGVEREARPDVWLAIWVDPVSTVVVARWVVSVESSVSWECWGPGP